MIVKLLTEQHLEFLSLRGGCRGSSESTLVKIPNCWKSHALAHMLLDTNRPLISVIVLSQHLNLTHQPIEQMDYQSLTAEVWVI